MVVVHSFNVDEVWAVRRLAGGHWDRPVRVSGSGPGKYDFAPQAAVDDSGRATVVWLRSFDESDDCPVMITHRARAAVRWSKPVRLAVTQGCGLPRLVANGRGDSAAQWTGSPFEGVRSPPLPHVV